MENKKELLNEQKKSFERDLEIIEKEILYIQTKLKEVIKDEEIYEFWVSKMSNFLTTRKQVKTFIKDLEKKLKEGDENDKSSDEK